ncbi:hypothetical protein GCM10009869_31910 [Amnibacterium kyonggiense]
MGVRHEEVHEEPAHAARMVVVVVVVVVVAVLMAVLVVMAVLMVVAVLVVVSLQVSHDAPPIVEPSTGAAASSASAW